MRVTIRFFATLRDRVGVDRAEVELADGATVATLLKYLGETYPKLAPALGTSIVAVNHDYAFAENPLSEGDEVGLFPPVSGGSGVDGGEGWPEVFAITAEPLDIDAIVNAISLPQTGAVCVFTGMVRGITRTSEGRLDTDYLRYEAYQPMAEKKLRQVAREIRERYPLVQGIALVQRIGRLDVGEVTVLVACAGGHRHDGIFEAARYGIDRLKEIVPVWKQEVGPDGQSWVEGHYRPTPQDTNRAPAPDSTPPD